MSNYRPPIALFVVTAGLAGPACLSRPVETIEPRNTVTITEDYTQSRVDKIDILLAIDDSGSMLDKQKILAVAVPDLVDALVNPPCVDDHGAVVSAPVSPLDDCPDGARREFEPVLDIHIGIISSSLGPRGSTWISCHDDDGRLLNRTPGDDQPTYEDKGFLVWRPEAEQAPAGLYTGADALQTDLQAMVLGVGQTGCGHEAQLESWYRFLVDPVPYENVTIGAANRAEPSGVDEELLAQRGDFLRPDSLVAIVMLADENDCSFRAEGYGYFTTAYEEGQGIMQFKARKECAENPNDPCCAPCGHAPEACPLDDTCDDMRLDDEQLLSNLTCIDQKRRYGVDLLYPISRYVAGLTQTEIEDRNGEIHKNPLLVSEDGLQRGQDRVFLAGVVGVPWQLIARDPNDLTKGYLDADERMSKGTWDTILGDPTKNVPPTDPHMIESIHPREGIAGPTSGPGADPLNGHEWDVTPVGTGDLQYACTFELPEPITCDVPGYGNCDCDPGHGDHNPLCQEPDGSYGDTQYRAKAYPGRRQLELLKAIGDQGIVGSICPAQVEDPARRDYGYLPAIEALIDRLKQELADPCLTRSLTPNSENQVACIVLEGRVLEAGQACSCDGPARSPVAPSHQQAVTEALEKVTTQAAGLGCFCEIDQLRDEPLAVCQSSTEEEPALDGEKVNGWCYIDASAARPVGNEQLVAHCEPTERRVIRFVGGGEPVEDSHVFITCQE